MDHINKLIHAFRLNLFCNQRRNEFVETTIGVYETISTMCEVTDDEKLRDISDMLSGDDIIYYSTKPMQ